MRTAFVILLFITFSSVNAQQTPVANGFRPLAGKNYVLLKNYYLLSLLQNDPNVKAVLEKDSLLLSLAAVKRQRLEKAFKECGEDAYCFCEAFKVSSTEVEQVGLRIKALYNTSAALKKLVSQRLIPSGTYMQFEKESPGVLLEKAWLQDAGGINYAIGVYGNGNKPHYPAIDSIGFYAKDKRFGYLLYTITYNILNETKASDIFFLPNLLAVQQLLEINDRGNAGDFEPMEEGINKLAFQKTRNIRWEQYPYTLILIPGAGPNDRETALSAEAKLRLRMGAFQYHQKKAPFIVVSGGRVHPYKTPYNEAEQMKRYLMLQMQVPEAAIIMEPHARHTTTNMRNCVRLIYRYGMPADKPCLTTTSRVQSRMITETLPERCKKELGLIPYKAGNRVSETEAEFFPALEALHIDPTEPMDP